jgi:hypothetical protein
MVIVCIKRVPDTVHVRSAGAAMEREGAGHRQPYDLYALGEALAGEAHGGSVAALTWGHPQAEERCCVPVARGRREGTASAGSSPGRPARHPPLARAWRIGEYHLSLQQAGDRRGRHAGLFDWRHLSAVSQFVRRCARARARRRRVMTEDGATSSIEPAGGASVVRDQPDLAQGKTAKAQATPVP